MGYETEMTKYGLLVRNVDIASFVAKGEREVPYDLDSTFYRDVITKFDDRRAKGKIGAYLFQNHGGPIIGRWVKLNWDGAFLTGDCLITNPASIAKFERGELPEISADIDLPRRFFVGASLLDHEGHFSEEMKSQTIPKELQAALSDDPEAKEARVYRLIFDRQSKLKLGSVLEEKLRETKKDKSKEELEDANMPMSDEMKAEIAQMIADAIAAAMKKETVEEEGEFESTGDPEKDVEIAAAKKTEQMEAEHKEKMAQFRIDTYVLQLSRLKGNVFTDNQLRQMLGKYKYNEQALEVEARRLADMSEDRLILEVEKELAVTGDEVTQLKLEFKNYKLNHPDTVLTEESWIDLQLGRFKNDLPGKQTISLGNEAFDHKGSKIRV